MGVCVDISANKISTQRPVVYGNVPCTKLQSTVPVRLFRNRISFKCINITAFSRNPQLADSERQAAASLYVSNRARSLVSRPPFCRTTIKIVVMR